MLIPSHRHKAADLAIWREMEGADRIHGERLVRGGKVKRGLDAIRRFVEGGPCVAGTSWGKDSVVLCHLLHLVAPEVELIHLRPTNHNPDCDAVRDCYLGQWPGQPYREVVVDYGRIHAMELPHETQDKETDRLWYAAIRESQKHVNGRHILGIRANESYGRKVRFFRWGENSTNGCAPLSTWTTEDIFGYLAIYGLPIHPSYAMLGGGRWPRERLRVAEIGDTHGAGGGRREWELEYYGDVIRRLEAAGRQG